MDVCIYESELFSLFSYLNLRKEEEKTKFEEKAKLMYKKEFLRSIFFLCVNFAFEQAIKLISEEIHKFKDPVKTELEFIKY